LAAAQVLPLKVIARPPRSTAMHHVVVGHETSLGCPRSGIVVTGALQTGGVVAAAAAATPGAAPAVTEAAPTEVDCPAGTDPLAGPAAVKASATSVSAPTMRPNVRAAGTMTPLSLRGRGDARATEC
jgi:hypothetical protein